MIILKNFEFAENIEITIESNPNSLTSEKTKIYFESGINRISIGAQSFNDKILKEIGRIHKSSDIYNAVENAKSAGFKNINLDLMLALPHQKFSDIEKSINCIEELKIPHTSYYSLILEEDTQLYEMHKKSPLSFPTEDEDRKMYHYMTYSLSKLEINQYEISNFSKNGYECRHNLNYWKLKDYISFGLSSSSSVGNLRYTNTFHFKNYFDSIDKNEKPIDFFENLSKKDRMNEFIMMGLRLNCGISLDEFDLRFEENFIRFYKNEIEKNIELGLIELKENRIYLTKKGRDLSNQVELNFFR